MPLRKKPSRRVFGPVLSRRLGYSLGADVLPFKTCDLDCVYCQLGRTTRKTLGRKPYVDGKEILDELASVLADAGKLDHVSFSGSGEPTLNSELGAMIRGAKKLSRIPVVVITNGTLLWDKDVQRDLMAADAVLPSLDAASVEVFERINRPVSGLPLAKVIEGLADFRKRYGGKLWLEVMLVKGFNDSAEELERIRDCIRRIRPDRVDINSSVRPSDEKASPVSVGRLKKAKALFGPYAVIIGQARKAPPPARQHLSRWRQGTAACRREKAPRTGFSARASAVKDIVLRRPVTAQDVRKSFGLKSAEASRLLEGLVEKGNAEAVRRSGGVYYRRKG
ncbi:MAG: radical SAM protein [Elusimicrobia bacterium]|nr:radical SAM protein [Elusimicrobiota bacterium]